MFTVCRGKVWTPGVIVRVCSLCLLALLSSTPSVRADEENAPRDRRPDLRAWRELQDRFDRWRANDRAIERRNDRPRAADGRERDRDTEGFRRSPINRSRSGPGPAIARRGPPIGRGPQFARRDLPSWRGPELARRGPPSWRDRDFARRGPPSGRGPDFARRGPPDRRPSDFARDDRRGPPGFGGMFHGPDFAGRGFGPPRSDRSIRSCRWRPPSSRSIRCTRATW